MFMGCSTFSEYRTCHRLILASNPRHALYRYTVIPECAVAKISRDAPLEKVEAAAAAAAAAVVVSSFNRSAFLAAA